MHKILLAVALALSAAPGRACEILEPFEISSIAGAEIVLVGVVTGYEVIDTTWGAALVTLRVEEVLKGPREPSTVYLWTAGMAQGPYAERATGRVLIGAMRGGRLAVTSRVRDLRPDLPSIVQPYCGELWMQPASPELVEAA